MYSFLMKHNDIQLWPYSLYGVCNGMMLVISKLASHLASYVSITRDMDECIVAHWSPLKYALKLVWSSQFALKFPLKRCCSALVRMTRANGSFSASCSVLVPIETVRLELEAWNGIVIHLRWFYASYYQFNRWYYLERVLFVHLI